MNYYQSEIRKQKGVKVEKRKKFLYGPILFKTLFISFISFFFLSHQGFGVNAEDLLETNSRAFVDEKDLENFLLIADASPVVFEGRSKDVTVMPMGMAALPLIHFENIKILRGGNLTEKTFPMRGVIQPDKLMPGRTWLAALQSIEGSGKYEIKSMIISTAEAKKQLIDLLSTVKPKSGEAARP